MWRCSINVLVVGAGAIGCLVGGQLASAGNAVTLLGRPALAGQVAAGGLCVQWPDDDPFTVQPKVITALSDLDDDDLARFDTVLVTVKSFDTETAVRPLAGRLAANTRLVSLQNGVGNEAILQAIFPAQPIVAGTITIPVAVPRPGTVVVAKNKGGIGLAPFAAASLNDVEAVAAPLRQVGFWVQKYHDAAAMKWSKLTLNMVCNAIPAILNMPPKDALTHRTILDMEIAALTEAMAVMRAERIQPVKLPGYPVPALALALRWLPKPLLRRLFPPVMVGGRGDKLPSLLLDVRNGRNQSEVNVLNLVVAQTGQSAHIPTPVNTAVSQILDGIITGRTPAGQFDGNPKALHRAVQGGIPKEWI